MIRLSIVIVTYNSEKDIFACIESVLLNNDIGEQMEIIIVDNGSKNTEQMFNKILQDFSSLNIKLIANTHNGGYGYGNNIGIKESCGDLILIMNPDVRLIKPIFRAVINKFDTSFNLGLVGLKQMETIGTRGQSFLLLEQSPINLFFHKICIKLDVFFPNFFCFSGACFFIRKKTMEEINYFDEAIFLYSEERDIHWRVRESNQNKILYLKELAYIHPVHARSFDLKNIILGLKSEKHVLEKNKKNWKKHIHNINLIYRILFVKNIFCLNFAKAKEIKDVLKKINENR